MASVMKKWLLPLIPCVMVSGSLWADDTDIYLNATGGSSATPLVMLTLDYRSNLGSTVSECSKKIASDDCKLHMGGERNVATGVVSETELYKLLVDDVTTSEVTLFDTMRAVFRYVLQDLSGIKVGFMINHDNTCKSSGPLAGECSNGAYILKGFFDPSDLTTAAQSKWACDLNTDNVIDPEADIINGPAPSYSGKGVCSNLEDLIYKLKNMMAPSGNLAHPYQGKELYLEYLRYLTGKPVYNGHLGYDDFDSNTPALNLDHTNNRDGSGNPTSMLAWDTSIETANGVSYITPFDNSGDWECSRVFAINTMFQVSQNEDDSDRALAASFALGGMGLTGNSTFPDVIQTMRDTDLATTTTLGFDVPGDQGLTSYFITDKVNKTTNGYASSGGTKTAYGLDTPAKLAEDLKSIFTEILSQSSIFVAASVPASVFNRLETGENIFFSLFEADEDPFWNGNVKKLKLVEIYDNDPNTPETGRIGTEIQDANGNRAFDSDGRIKSDALTLWTDLNGPDLVGDDPDGEALDGVDGRQVNRGGAGQKIPGFLSDVVPLENGLTGARTLYTEGSTAGTLMALNANDATAAALKADFKIDDADFANAAAATAYAKELLTWLRGQDVDDLDNDSSTTDSRPWLLGDPMHSRPIALNYGALGAYTEANPRIQIYFGSNDGFLHWVENTTSGSGDSGIEAGGFIPRSLLVNVATLRDENSPPVTPPLPNAKPHPYGMDGEPTVYIQDRDGDGSIESSDGDKAILFIGMRRGGYSYFAFDISNPDTPPDLLWTINQTSGGQFDDLALTFSTPQVAIIQYEENPRVAVVFAGGYNGGWNSTLTDRVGKDENDDDDSIGNAIFIVNAFDGELIWKAQKGSAIGAVTSTVDPDTAVIYEHTGLVDSIPATVKLYDSDNDGLDDRVYVGDTGGAVWRLDMPAVQENSCGGDGQPACSSRKDNWFLSKIAELGTDGDPNDRRFFHSVDIARTDDGTPYDAIVITSGNRADPKEDDIENYAFMIKDRKIVSGDSTARQDHLTAADNRVPLVVSDFGNITECLIGTEPACSNSIAKGWRLELEAVGEKGLADPVISQGEIFFTSFLPKGESGGNNVCAPSAGSGRIYIVGLPGGKPTRNLFGSADSVVKQDRYTQATSTGIPASPVNIPGAGVLSPSGEFYQGSGSPRQKLYWREMGVDKLN